MSAVFGPQKCQSAPAANLTGPCLAVACVNDSDYGADCWGEVALCDRGSTDYTPYFSTVPGSCQYYCEQSCVSDCPNNGATDIQSQDCGIYELAGQIAGSGDTWSLYDTKSTVLLDYTTGTNSIGPFTVFYVDMTDPSASAQYNYFIAKASAEDAGAAVSTSSTTPITRTSTSIASTGAGAGVLTALSTATVSGSGTRGTSLATGTSSTGSSVGSSGSGTSLVRSSPTSTSTSSVSSGGSEAVSFFGVRKALLYALAIACISGISFV